MSHSYATLDPDIADEVAAFLHAHPSFLADNPELYRVLAPPVRLHGDAFADHMAAMIRAERRASRSESHRVDGLLAAGRAAAGIAGRVHGAVLALMRAADPVDCACNEWPDLLGVDAVSVGVEAILPGLRELPRGTIQKHLRGREAAVRQSPADARLLHGEAAGLARVDALVRVRIGPREGVLALAARDRLALRQEGGNAALCFLGQSLTAALDRIE